MLRKLSTFGALALVALAFGVGAASAKLSSDSGLSPTATSGHSSDGFSDGRFGS